MTRLAIFDCDGTLIDSQANTCRAMAAAFVTVGLTPPGDARVRLTVGLSLAEAVASLLPEEDAVLHHRLVAEYRTCFQDMRMRGEVDEPLFPGVRDVLTTLDATGWVMGVATGKSRRGLDHALERHGLTGFFATLQTADTHPSKPHPSMVAAGMADVGAAPAATTVIGDTSFDMAMASAAGARGIGVGWGYHPVAELYRAGAAAVAARPADLVAIMDA